MKRRRRPGGAKDLLLELGTEELPASFVEPALEDLRRILTERLESSRLRHGGGKLCGPRRRLAVLVRGVSDRSEDVVKDVLGPSAKAAFGPDGTPPRAAEKFAESVGLKPETLSRTQTGKGEYVSAKVEEKG